MPYHSAQLLVFLWGVALIFSGIGTYYEPDTLVHSWNSLIAVIAGFGVVMRPLCKLTLRLSVWGYLAAFLAQMPANPNHRWVLFLAALSFTRGLNSISGANNQAKYLQGSLRWVTIVVYVFAALAKVNTSYLDPSTSCAKIFSDQTFFLYRIDSLLHEHVSLLIGGFSLVAEALLPMLLIWPRSRIFAVACGIAFHIFLALNLTRYFANFSAAMFVLLVSWLPEECCARIYRATVKHLIPSIRVWIFALVSSVALSLAGSVSATEYLIVRHVLFLAFAFLLLILVIRASRGVIIKERVGQPSLLVLIIAIFNAFTPYLGIKTRAALTMYSNLRIEPEYSNHLFMPNCPDPFGLLSDRVEIVATTHPGLYQRLQESSSPEQPYTLPYAGLCTFMACQDELCLPTQNLQSVSYRRAGVLVTHALNLPLPADCPPWIVRKLLLFGPLGPNAERSCLW